MIAPLKLQRVMLATEPLFGAPHGWQIEAQPEV